MASFAAFSMFTRLSAWIFSVSSLAAFFRLLRIAFCFSRKSFSCLLTVSACSFPCSSSAFCISSTTPLCCSTNSFRLASPLDFSALTSSSSLATVSSQAFLSLLIPNSKLLFMSLTFESNSSSICFMCMSFSWVFFRKASEIAFSRGPSSLTSVSVIVLPFVVKLRQSSSVAFKCSLNMLVSFSSDRVEIAAASFFSFSKVT
mmetsp:Transcript_10337/g.21267  ORF Transcript_10337/g.21267 Transcript_10337/m.21267 type:complete len:202 (-) Transcript_10337:172-777(-)